MTQVYSPPLQHEEGFRRSPRRRADSTELNEALPYNIRPRHEFFIAALRGASKSASTDLNDQME